VQLPSTAGCRRLMQNLRFSDQGLISVRRSKISPKTTIKNRLTRLSALDPEIGKIEAPDSIVSLGTRAFVPRNTLS
jgi:hypothetical protein